MPPLQPFRLVHRAFGQIGFDPRKSDEVLAERALIRVTSAACIHGYVLEREDTRPYRETRYQSIGDVLGDLFVVVYTLRPGGRCRLITAWEAEPYETEIWNHAMR